jgi:hypothetical protein
MKFVIAQSHDGFTRTIDINVEAGAGKRLADVETVYDGFSLGHDSPNPAVSTYARTFKRQEGITPNQPHTVQVRARHVDGTTDAGSRTWND